MMPEISQWLIDSLIASSALCLFVLLVRRPVARYFGPQLAYALWLLPAARMILPPLPALWGMTIADSIADQPTVFAGQEMTVAPSISAQQPTDIAWFLPEWLPLSLLAIWAIGALVFLGWQWSAHRRLLVMLRGADTVSWIGGVRIVSSREVSGPLSFGLWSPVIMLPDDQRLPLNRLERDLAIAHEHAHHRRGDLWANAGAVLFASLHWFNPLMHYAWRAFRFDQEAACDAAVLIGADNPRRGAYARVLAKAASGRPSVFASAMLGSDKLKERLTMLIEPTPSPLRRRVGMALGGIALLTALGITASTASADPAEPAAPPATTVDGATTVDRSREDGEEVTRIRDGDGTTIVIRTNDAIDQAEIDRIVAEARASHAQARPADESGGTHRTHTMIIHRTGHDATGADMPVPPAPPALPATGDAQVQQRTRIAIIRSHEAAEAHTAATAEQREAHAAARAAQQHVRIAAIRNARSAMVSGEACGHGETGTRAIDMVDEDSNGRSEVRVITCGTYSPALELSALRAARQSMAAMPTNAHLTAERLAAAMARVDAQIAELERAAE